MLVRLTGQCNWVMRPRSKRRRGVGPWIELPNVPVAGHKEFTPLHHFRLDKDREHMHHIIPRPVRGIGELQPVDRILEGGCPTGQKGEQPLACCCNV